MLVRRLAVVGVIAVLVTIIGVMTMGVAETLKFGLYGLAAAGVLLLLMRVMSRRSAGPPPASGKASGKSDTSKSGKGGGAKR